MRHPKHLTNFASIFETTWQFYTLGGEAQDAIYRAFEKANQTIDCESYIFETDTIGTKFFELLKKKAKAGVRVRVLLDMIGSFSLYASPLLLQELRDAGVQVRFFNPIELSRLHRASSFFFRDHRKFFIIDSQIGFTGSINIRDDMRAWRETMLEIHGPIVGTMEYSFEQFWKQAGKKKTFFRFRKARSFTKGFRLLSNSPRYSQKYLYWDFISHIQHAKKSIYLTTPYFAPDFRFLRVLKLAVRRGVDVKIILPEHADIEWIQKVTESFYATTLDGGIELYTYTPRFIHAKTAVIDGEYTLVGSLNLDTLSFHFDYEAAIESTNPRFVAEVGAQFTEDLAQSTKIDKESWKKRPLLSKIVELGSYLSHRLLYPAQ